MEECYEQFLTKNYGNRQEYLNGTATGLLFLTAVGFFGLRSLVLAVPSAITFIILKLYIRKTFVEYEYELICDELTISKIINKRKRKKIVNIELRNILEQKALGNKKVHDVFIDDKGLTKKVICIKEKNEIKAYRVALDKKLLAKCTRVNPRIFSVI